MKAGVTKEQLVKGLGETLSLTHEGISHLELKDKRYHHNSLEQGR